MKNIDIIGVKDNNPIDIYIDWVYPGIYGDKKSHLILSLCHKRAADDIRISYDSDRDGWKIEQASIFEWEADDEICDPDWQEVAFIQAWAREKNNKENK